MQAVKHGADRRWRRRSARVELDRAAGFALSARSASAGEARKVELGAGRPKPTASMPKLARRLDAKAATRASTSRSIRRCGPGKRAG